MIFVCRCKASIERDERNTFGQINKQGTRDKTLTVIVRFFLNGFPIGDGKLCFENEILKVGIYCYQTYDL